MVETERALAGTSYLSPAKHTAFYDYYHKQYAQTLAVLQHMLAEAAGRRDRQRTTADPTAQRQRLAQLTGFAQVMSPVTQVEQTPLAEGVNTYRVACANGLLY